MEAVQTLSLKVEQEAQYYLIYHHAPENLQLEWACGFLARCAPN